MNWFKHDIGSLEDDRFSFLVDRYGSDGYAVFFLIVEELYRNGGNPIGSLSLKKIARQLSLGLERVIEIAEYACSDECEGLLEKDGHKYSSERVHSAIEEKDKKVKQTKEAVRKRWENYYKKMNADALRTYNERISDVEQTQNERKTDVIQIREDKRRGEEIREDKNDKSSSSEESLSLKEELSCSDEQSNSNSSSNNAHPREDSPLFVILKDGQMQPLSENYIRTKQETFPGVDVIAELRNIQSRTEEFPQCRLSFAGFDSFINRWLYEASKRRGGDPAPKQRRVKMAGGDEWAQWAGLWTEERNA